MGIPANLPPDRIEAAVEALLDQLMRVGGLDTAEALVELRRERIRRGFAEEAAKKAESHLRKAVAQGSHEDVGRIALMNALADELGGGLEPVGPGHLHVHQDDVGPE